MKRPTNQNQFYPLNKQTQLCVWNVWKIILTALGMVLQAPYEAPTIFHQFVNKWNQLKWTMSQLVTGSYSLFKTETWNTAFLKQVVYKKVPVYSILSWWMQKWSCLTSVSDIVTHLVPYIHYIQCPIKYYWSHLHRTWVTKASLFEHAIYFYLASNASNARIHIIATRPMSATFMPAIWN